MTQATWIPMMEQAVKFIYSMSESPDLTCADLVKEIYSQAISDKTDGQLSLGQLTRYVL